MGFQSINRPHDRNIGLRSVFLIAFTFCLTTLLGCSAQSTAAPLPSVVVQASSTFTPEPATSTPEPTVIPATATETELPTEVPIPSFMADFRFVDQFKVSKNEAWISCIMDVKSLRQTDFTVANLRIIAIVDCYLIDHQDKLQKVSLPVGMVDEIKAQWATWGRAIEPLAHPNLDFTWNKVEGTWTSRNSSYGQYREGGFSTAHDPRDGQDWTNFLGQAVDAMQPSAEGLNLNGTTDGLPDFPNAENFVMPMTVN